MYLWIEFNRQLENEMKNYFPGSKFAYKDVQFSMQLSILEAEVFGNLSQTTCPQTCHPWKSQEFPTYSISGSNTLINTKFAVCCAHLSLLGAQLSSIFTILSPWPHSLWNHFSKLADVIAPYKIISKLGNCKTPSRTFWWCLSYSSPCWSL